MDREIESLIEPVSEAAPCGVDLEDTQLLARFDGYRLFGSDIALPKATDWREIRDTSLEALAQSRDLRLLAHLAAAVIRIEGLVAFCRVAAVANRWLSDHWDVVFPRVDEDALLRKNALNCLADRMAIVDALRRAPIMAHRQLGAFCLRDLELASGQLSPTEDDAKAPNSAQIEAILAGSAVEQLSDLSAQVEIALASLRTIVSTMQTRSGFESAPDFDRLLKPLSRIAKLLTDHLPNTAASAATTTQSNGHDLGASISSGAVTDIRTRQDAIRAIDAVAEFFRSHEPSSPVPLFLERAKRLISKSFMEVLEDIAPDSLTQAKLIGGIKGDEVR